MIIVPPNTVAIVGKKNRKNRRILFSIIFIIIAAAIVVGVCLFLRLVKNDASVSGNEKKDAKSSYTGVCNAAVVAQYEEYVVASRSEEGAGAAGDFIEKITSNPLSKNDANCQYIMFNVNVGSGKYDDASENIKNLKRLASENPDGIIVNINNTGILPVSALEGRLEYSRGDSNMGHE